MSVDTPLPDPRAIGSLVRSRRQELGLTQSALASLANVSIVFLNELEQGKPTARVELIFRVLQAIGIDLYARPR
jgi:HTH-type transcriptional regulator/antitoxin HipB